MTRRIILFCLFAILTSGAFASVELEARRLAPTAGLVSNVASAFAAGRYLTVWRQLEMPYVGIWGAFSDPDGRPLGPAFPVQTGANATQLRLFAEGDSFLLVWDEAHDEVRMCHVDLEGRATLPRAVDASWLGRGGAFVDGRLMVVVADAGASIFDAGGDTVRGGIAPANLWSAQMAFEGEHSFYLTGRWPDLTLSRYSLDGDLLQTFTFATGQCQTTTAVCWTIVGVQELGSGRLLLLLQSQSQLATMTVAADGTASERLPLPVSLPEVRSAGLSRAGTQPVAVVSGGAPSTGPTEVVAIPLDQQGTPDGEPVTLMSGLGFYELTAFAEGPAGLLSVAVAGPYPSQVETVLFRGGQVGEPRAVSITPTIQRESQVASNGTSFLAAWRDADGVGFDEVHWAVLDAAGQRQSAVFAGGGNLVPHSLVSNGSDYLMLISYGGPVVARRVASDGTLLGETPLYDATGAEAGAAVVPVGTGYLIVGSSGGEVRSLRLTASGSVDVAREIIRIEGVPEGYTAAYEDPALASDGSQVLLVLRRHQSEIIYFPGPDVATARLEAVRLGIDGTPLVPSPLQIESAAALGNRPIAGSSGTEFFVACDTERFLISPDGDLTVLRKQQGGAATDLVWDGSLYALARGSDRLDRIGRDGSVVEARIHPGPQGLDVATDAAGRLLLVGSESGDAGPLRAFAYAGSEFLPFPNRRRAATP